MERKNVTQTIGAVNLADISLDEESLDVIVGIDRVPERVQGIIDTIIETQKTGTGTGIKTELSLHVTVRNGAFAYCLDIDVFNQDGTVIAAMCVEVNLDQFQNELEKVIIKAMIDNLF